MFSLSDEDRLEIYDAIFLYSKYSEKPEFKSDIVIPLFYMFKNTLDRDSKKYEQVCERNKNNGEKGGRPQKNKEKNIDKNPVGFSETQENLLKPKKPDKDNDSDNDSYNDNVNVNDNDNKNGKNISTSSFSSKKVYGDLFSEFWSLYPKKIGKGGANKVFERLKLNNDDLLQIKNALKWQKQSEQWQKNGGQFIPNPSTYLSQRRWEDEPFEASTPDYTNPDRYEEVYNNDLPF